MKTFIKVGLVFCLGAAIGFCYDGAAWIYHIPYFSLNWLGPLIGADGEKGYDALLYESMIEFGVALVFAVISIRSLAKKLSSSQPWSVRG
jgi:hypothetical protein